MYCEKDKLIFMTVYADINKLDKTFFLRLPLLPFYITILLLVQHQNFPKLTINCNPIMHVVSPILSKLQYSTTMQIDMQC